MLRSNTGITLVDPDAGIYRLTVAGWFFTALYAGLTLAMGFLFLAPSNRRIRIDLARGTLVIGGPYGIGTALDAPLAKVAINYEENARVIEGNTHYSGKLSATVGARRFAVASLATKAIDIVRELARLLPAAAVGEVVDLRNFERMVAENARGSARFYLTLLALSVAPGILYVVVYAR